MRGSRLTAVELEEVGHEEGVAPATVGASPSVAQKEKAATSLLLAALAALSQRTVIALSNLFMLLTGASAFILWYFAPADPSTRQLIALALYALFILALNYIKRRN